MSGTGAPVSFPTEQQQQQDAAAQKMLKSLFRTPLKQLQKLLAGHSKTKCHAILPELNKDPGYWGIEMKRVLQLQEHICADMAGYCSDHDLGMDFAHVCRRSPCPWHHHGAVHHARTHEEKVRCAMLPNMHTVVRRYVAPWTAPLGVGYSSAVLADTAHRTINTEKTLRAASACTVFISHCWNEAFADFCSTLRAHMDPSTVVWVCSLGINQNADIAGEIGGGLYDVPFAVALKRAERVLVVMDTAVEPLTRAWCVLEAHFAFSWDKPYDIALPNEQNHVNEAAWELVDRRMRYLDIRECMASYHDDLVRILTFVESKGGIEALNSSIHGAGARAASRASVLAATSAGRADILRGLSTEVLDVEDSRGRTLLHYAAARGHAEVISFLAGAGGDFAVNRADMDGRTALSVAAESAAAAVCARLLACRASVDVGEDLFPLHYAAVCGRPEVAECLLQAAAEVDVKSELARSPLYYAAMVRDVPMVELLLNKRAAMDQKNKLGFLPLHVVAQSFKASDVPGAINDVARGTGADVVACLRAHGADLDAKTTDGRTATRIAAESGQTSTLEALLSLRADPNLSNKKKLSPLHSAASSGHCKCLQALVNACADIDSLTAMGSSPLKLAVHGGKVAASKLLLGLRADPNTGGGESMLPLHSAAKEGRVEILRALLAHGADANAKFSKRGFSTLAIAARAGQQEAVEELLVLEPFVAGLSRRHASQTAQQLAPALVKAVQTLIPPGKEQEEDGKFPCADELRASANDFLTCVALGAWQASTDAAKDGTMLCALEACMLVEEDLAEVARAESSVWDGLLSLLQGCLQACGSSATAAGLLSASEGASRAASPVTWQ